MPNALFFLKEPRKSEKHEAAIGGVDDWGEHEAAVNAAYPNDDNDVKKLLPVSISCVMCLIFF